MLRLRPKLLLLVMLGGAALNGCRMAQPATNQLSGGNAAPAEPAEPRAPPQPERRLDRRALLLAATAARSAAAAGADDRQEQADLDGRLFQFAIPFGCAQGGEGQPPPSLTVEHGEEGAELRATPDVNAEHPLVASIAGDRFEAAEGFWVPHPWILAPVCPAQPVPGPVPQQIAIAQFFAPAESRLERRDNRPFETRAEAEAGQQAAAPSWHLVLEGRLRHVDGRAINCGPASGVPPVCIVSVEIERVTFRDVTTDETLAEWRRG